MEASILRGALEASEIFCFVQGEHHRSMLGVMGQYVALNLMVRRGDLEVARELIREQQRLAAEALAAEAGRESDDDARTPDAGRVKTGKSKTTARLLAIVPALGAGHHYVGAHGRGVLISIVQAFGINQLVHGKAVFGVVLIVLGVLVDLAAVGSVIDDQSRR